MLLCMVIVFAQLFYNPPLNTWGQANAEHNGESSNAIKVWFSVVICLAKFFGSTEQHFYVGNLIHTDIRKRIKEVLYGGHCSQATFTHNWCEK